MSLRIEHITELPRTELAPLIAESTQAGWLFVQRLVDEWTAGTNRFNRPGEALFVARDGERLVGVCGLNIDPYVESARTGRVRRLYVCADYRRHGVGGQLVERVIELARGNFDELRLRTNNPEAARFYEALGFRAVGGDADCTHSIDLSSR